MNDKTTVVTEKPVTDPKMKEELTKFLEKNKAPEVKEPKKPM